MIQAIVLAIIAIWLTWGIINVVRGFIQILCGVACGFAAAGLYTLAYILEFAGFVANKLR